MARPPAHAAATPNPEAVYTPPHGAHAPRSKAAPPPSAPTYLRQNAWPRSRMYIPPRRAPESPPPSASSPPHPAAEYSILRSAGAEQAHPAHPPQAFLPSTMLQSSRSAAHSAKDHSQNVHTVDRQTMAASSSSQPPPPSCPPTAAFAHKSPAPSAQLLRSDGSFGISPEESGAHPYKRWVRVRSSSFLPGPEPRLQQRVLPRR